MSIRHLRVSVTYLVPLFQFRSISRVQRLLLKVPSISVLETNLVQNVRFLSSSSNPQSEEEIKDLGELVKFTFVTHQGEHIEVEGKCGETLKTVAEKYDSIMEGACEGVLACTTCHCYVPDEIANAFAEPSQKEDDLLDTAPFLKPNSRLSCQLKVSKDIEGAHFKLPKGTVNMQVDGFQPKKH